MVKCMGKGGNFVVKPDQVQFEKNIYLNNEQETEVFAKKVANNILAGDVLCLVGDLGVGKTTFTRYLARALGITGPIKSPSFTIVREYDNGQLPLYHIDAYRIEESGPEGIGLEDYLNSEGICVIEWPQFIKDYLPNDYLEFMLKRDGEITRCLTIKSRGPRSRSLLKALSEC